MDCTDKAKTYHDTLQNMAESKRLEKKINPIDWNLPMYFRPSVICKLSKGGVSSNMISQPSSSGTALHQESNYGRSSEAFPLNSQEKDVCLIPASRQKDEDDSAGVSSLPRKRTASQACLGEPHEKEDESTASNQKVHKKRTVSQACLGEPHQIEDESFTPKQKLHKRRTVIQARVHEPHQREDESSAFKQKYRVGKTVHCPRYYRRRTIIQANLDEPHPGNSTVIKQENKDTAYLTWLHGMRSKMLQASFAKQWSRQREDESTAFKPEDYNKYRIGHLPWMHEERTVKQDCPNKAREIIDESAVFKQDDGNWETLHLPWMHRKKSVKQDCLIEAREIIDESAVSGKQEDGNWETLHIPLLYGKRIINQDRPLGEPHPKDDSIVFKQERTSEDTAGHDQWFNKMITIKQASLGEPSANQRENQSKHKREDTKGHLPWLYENRSIEQARRLGESQQREVESTALKEGDKETTAHLPWLNGIRTIKETRLLHESQQREVDSTTLNEQDKKTAVHLPLLNGMQVPLGVSQQRVKSTSFMEENSEKYHRKQLQIDQCKNPSEDKETDILGYEASKSQKQHGSSPSSSFNSMRHDLTGCSNVARGNRGTTCPVCYKMLSRFNHLKSHMLIHTGEKPYECAYCTKTFNQIGNRNAHQRIHTGEKRYTCDYCGKRFIFSSSKHNHMKVHRCARSDDETK